MGKTKEILLKIRDAVMDGRLAAEDVPIEDLKQCVYDELQVNSITVPEQQVPEVLNRFELLCNSVSEKETDISKIQMFLDAMILCVDMISPVIYALINGDYWRYKHRENADNPEIAGIIEYIDKERRVLPISYDFVKEYEKYPVEVYRDGECGMMYVPYKGRKMYFPASWDGPRIANYYSGIMMEQDERSPHYYYDEDFGVREGDVVVDAGAAEGNFSLDYIDKASKIYLIEADAEWVAALKQTFRNDAEKVRIIEGYLGSFQEGIYVSIEGLFEEEEINYIKMDIEGAERAALAGAVKVLEKGKNIRCAICAYHCKGDEQNIRSALESHGFVTKTSKGYMSPAWTMEAYLEAEIRRGLVFGKKE